MSDQPTVHSLEDILQGDDTPVTVNSDGSVSVEYDFPRARHVMAEALKDESFRLSYRSNIAMLLHDHYGVTDSAERNQAAEDILKLVFES